MSTPWSTCRSTRFLRRRERRSEKIDDDGFLFKANFAWDVTDDSMLYATYSQGYRHAGANAVPTTGKYAENPDYFTFDSDSVDNYELGYKGMTDLVTFAVSLYYTDWQDPQLNTAPRTGASSPRSMANRPGRRVSKWSCPARSPTR